MRLVSDTVGTLAACITNPVTAGAFFAAVRADGFADLIASAALVLTFTAFKTEFTVVTQTAILHTLAAFAAMVLAVAVTVSSLAAMIAIVAFPVIVAIAAAVFTLHAVFIRRGNRKRE